MEFYEVTMLGDSLGVRVSIAVFKENSLDEVGMIHNHGFSF